MKLPTSSKMIADEPRSHESVNRENRNARRSHVSVSSNKRPSVNTGGTNSSKIQHGAFRRAVPQMPRALACLCFVLNLILPGTGMNKTILSSIEWICVVFLFFSTSKRKTIIYITIITQYSRKF
jgi:hypothetical protein